MYRRAQEAAYHPQLHAFFSLDATEALRLPHFPRKPSVRPPKHRPCCLRCALISASCVCRSMPDSKVDLPSILKAAYTITPGGAFSSCRFIIGLTTTTTPARCFCTFSC